MLHVIPLFLSWQCHPQLLGLADFASLGSLQQRVTRPGKGTRSAGWGSLWDGGCQETHPGQWSDSTSPVWLFPQMGGMLRKSSLNYSRTFIVLFCLFKWRSACTHQFHSCRPRINPQWLSKPKWLWTCNLIELPLSSFHWWPEQHSQPSVTVVSSSGYIFSK